MYNVLTTKDKGILGKYVGFGKPVPTSDHSPFSAQILLVLKMEKLSSPAANCFPDKNNIIVKAKAVHTKNSITPLCFFIF
jgi:hypothetical protein